MDEEGIVHRSPQIFKREAHLGKRSPPWSFLQNDYGGRRWAQLCLNLDSPL